MKQYDAIIIGFGKGGKTLAADLAAQGKQIALIEQSDHMYGGTCINVGCIPTKSLVHSAKLSVYQKPRSFEEQARLYELAIQEKRRLTAALRGKNYDKLQHFHNVTIYNGVGSFVSSHEVQVQMERETVVLAGSQIFINTGSTPVIPDIPGIQESVHVYTSEQLLELEQLPRHLVIIGGGYIGLEFASFYAGFGAKVTVLQDTQVFLPREDADITAEIRKVMEGKGVSFETGVQVTKVVDREDGVQVFTLQDGEERLYFAQAVLVATGRRPNTDRLNLEAAGIQKTARGAVRVDEFLRTNVPNIWAMGDVAGGLQFTYVSLDDYRIVRDQLMGNGRRTTADRRTVPYSVFIDPAFSRVGLSERQALEQGYPIKLARLPVAAIPKAQVLREPEGLLKVVIHAKTDRILGAMLFCAESYEMINLVKLAMDADLPYTHLKNMIFTHPTMSEAFNDLFGAV